MSQYFEIHPDNPQSRLIKQSVEIINKGGVIIYPTDSSYAIGCHLGDKKAMDRIRMIRQLDKDHDFTLVCRDLSEISHYAVVDNLNYRLMKSLTPGPYTFILPATREVPKRLLNPKRKTIGIRVPDNAVCSALLEELDQPIMSSTLSLPNDEYPLNDPYQIRLKLENMVDLIIDGGYSGHEETTVVSLTEDKPVIIRQGLGSADWLQQH
ncbi:L-threonylcarbamoyladenylate synthase [Cocleimonas flava]|jgi:tRNA threonylcarbamoyl adenosine modification protein (Sua5/YciO/YrdC/YwlC family)|uniref:tRNA threonylcarbamoyl adenosine modification protein (Sua5/YciO/YrdC/YwlC family) n=1 Tax=Cocleimonas flava TaxID=634765 RepID=A0A4R1FAA1_9GAMM|nr:MULTISPECIES: L-threonylcarbamoyladenylate synthase [Cocleimonas]MEB8433006.1 L-threonylcarbamoyladenylate synthase [Cocleimonas sp. KMM 6892]MEC4716013.1 L-threonylcarbamoyladenylate synthase [Cocleimonas sp. KMM 6895]MEC4745474.1 L-threonylcarbamoyladenylate synthase [Cocleimonas sp. KMM 6896]TCJ87751.1 tRNA threonylcarbamoyl adenosine modification protein (Sua5/YciO/YrdC/YwlC family) [Cocleimonas flava]